MPEAYNQTELKASLSDQYMRQSFLTFSFHVGCTQFLMTKIFFKGGEV